MHKVIGIFGIFLNRKNVIVILMSIELMLLAVNINFVAFSSYLGDLVGQVFTMFVLTVAAALGAILVGATFFPACAVRSEVLVVLGDLNAAAAELDRYLRLVPTNVEARRRLVDRLSVRQGGRRTRRPHRS